MPPLPDLSSPCIAPNCSKVTNGDRIFVQAKTGQQLGKETWWGKKRKRCRDVRRYMPFVIHRGPEQRAGKSNEKEKSKQLYAQVSGNVIGRGGRGGGEQSTKSMYSTYCGTHLSLTSAKVSAYLQYYIHSTHCNTMTKPFLHRTLVQDRTGNQKSSASSSTLF